MLWPCNELTEIPTALPGYAMNVFIGKQISFVLTECQALVFTVIDMIICGEIENILLTHLVSR